MIYQVRNYWDRGIKVIERPVIRETPKFVIVPDLYSANYVDRLKKARRLSDWWGHSREEAIQRFIDWCDAEIRFVKARQKKLESVRSAAQRKKEQSL
jgi:hypothetical protein